MFDIATLTGACPVALGQTMQAAYSNNGDIGLKLMNMSLKNI